MERQGFLQDKLVDLMLSETKIQLILELSPYTDIRKEAYSFIQEQVSPVSSLRHAFQRDLMDGSLNAYIQPKRENFVYLSRIL